MQILCWRQKPVGEVRFYLPRCWLGGISLSKRYVRNKTQLVSWMLVAGKHFMFMQVCVCVYNYFFWVNSDVGVQWETAVMEIHYFHQSLPVGGHDEQETFIFRNFVTCSLREATGCLGRKTYSQKTLALLFLNAKFVPLDNKLLLSLNRAVLLFILYLNNAFIMGKEMKYLEYMNLLKRRK